MYCVGVAERRFVRVLGHILYSRKLQGIAFQFSKVCIPLCSGGT